MSHGRRSVQRSGMNPDGPKHEIEVEPFAYWNADTREYENKYSARWCKGYPYGVSSDVDVVTYHVDEEVAINRCAIMADAVLAVQSEWT
jgi:hypothetical protein